MRNSGLVLVFVLALVLVGGTVAAQPAAEPPNTSHATFVSTGALQWDVTIGEVPACSTPCTLSVPPLQFVALHSREANPVRLDVGMIPGGDVTVEAQPLAHGRYAGGICGTTFSGMALATGVTLAAVGYGTDNSGMRTAGLIAGVAGGVGLYLSIELMQSALPRVQIGPAHPYMAPNQVGFAGRF
jgi:hypothetical protein